MSIVKIKQPVEYSFLQWINNFPNSGHWKDKERFFRFVKTVCRYNARNWKKPNYLKKRILQTKPHFDKQILDGLLNLYADLLQFHKIRYCSSQLRVSKRNIKEGHYIEIRVKNGTILETELPYDFI